VPPFVLLLLAAELGDGWPAMWGGLAEKLVLADGDAAVNDAYFVLVDAFAAPAAAGVSGFLGGQLTRRTARGHERRRCQVMTTNCVVRRGFRSRHRVAICILHFDELKQCPPYVDDL
jgi:hypothetical protein